MEYIEKTIDNGGIIILMTVALLVAIIFKTICSFCYDEILDKVSSQCFRDNYFVKKVIDKYNQDIKAGQKINNLEFYVKTELHKWKKIGIKLDRLNSYGNAAAIICIIAGLGMDIAIFAGIGKKEFILENMIMDAAVYTFVPLLFWGALKFWNEVVALDNKREVILDEIVNYLENPREYVKLVEKIKTVNVDDNRKTEEKKDEDSAKKNINNIEKKDSMNKKNKAGKRDVIDKEDEIGKRDIIDKEDEIGKRDIIEKVEKTGKIGKIYEKDKGNEVQKGRVIDEVLDEYLS